ncbi:hypothetical protein NX059_006557 [Plenodomus lindquistii]|nr:hypothetical protein NX059_006557 [Plenodomus lindquistii]
MNRPWQAEQPRRTRRSDSDAPSMANTPAQQSNALLKSVVLDDSSSEKEDDDYDYADITTTQSANYNTRTPPAIATPSRRRSSALSTHNAHPASPIDSWEFVNASPPSTPSTLHTTPTPTPTAATAAQPPSYSFPGTWTTAFNDTTAALSSVTTASTSYASALSRSGLGRASRSIGAALLNSTNRGALGAAGWVVGKTGVMRGELPRGVREWLEREERRKMARGGGVEVDGDGVMQDRRGSFVLETRERDGDGGWVGGLVGGKIMGGGEGADEEEEESDGLLRVFELDE